MQCTYTNINHYRVIESLKVCQYVVSKYYSKYNYIHIWIIQISKLRTYNEYLINIQVNVKIVRKDFNQFWEYSYFRIGMKKS